MYFIKFLLFLQQIINLNKKGGTALYRNYFVNISFKSASGVVVGAILNLSTKTFNLNKAELKERRLLFVHTTKEL